MKTDDSIERANRINRGKFIIAKFLSYSDRETVLSITISPKDADVALPEDYSMAVRSKREMLKSVMHPEWAKRKKSRLKFDKEPENYGHEP